MSYNELKELVETKYPAILAKNSKFAPKLHFAERCSILALDRLDISRRIIAVAFGVSRFTVRSITNPASKHYKQVREEFSIMGREKFLDRYVTEDVLERITLSGESSEVQLSDDKLSEMRTNTSLRTPNIKAVSKSGYHKVTTDDPEGLTINVVWNTEEQIVSYCNAKGLDFDDLEEHLQSGWVVVMPNAKGDKLHQQLSGETFDTYHTVLCFRTSTLALNAYLSATSKSVI